MSPSSRATSAGLKFSLESRVAPYYGDAILEQAREVLAELGVKHARVAIHDEGALPFTIGARIEAAAQSARASAGRNAGCRSSILCRRLRRKTACGGRGFICRARSQNTSSTPRSMRRMR